MRIIWASILILLFFSSCDNFDTKRQLVWSDEFEYSGTPDSSKWGYDLGDGCPNLCGWGNNEAQYYTAKLNNVRVENGVLIIEAHKDSLNGKAYTSSRLVSKLKGDWTYGRIEVKAKLPRGKGTWSAIWMLPTDWEYGGWPASGEIDIMEHVGYNPGIIHGSIHTKAYNHLKRTQKEGTISITDAQDEFHVYAINWTKNKIDFMVDDEVYHTVLKRRSDKYPEWPFDKRFHLLLNLAIGGFWGGIQGIDDKIFPQKMEIDYVRVYQ
jgi:beta-glucanase (GH16 family)